jgi:hypothetical protein
MFDYIFKKPALLLLCIIFLKFKLYYVAFRTMTSIIAIKQSLNYWSIFLLSFFLFILFSLLNRIFSYPVLMPTHLTIPSFQYQFFANIIIIAIFNCLLVLVSFQLLRDYYFVQLLSSLESNNFNFFFTLFIVFFL